MKEISAQIGSVSGTSAVDSSKAAGGAKGAAGAGGGAFAALFGLIAGGKDKLRRSVAGSIPTKATSAGSGVDGTGSGIAAIAQGKQAARSEAAIKGVEVKNDGAGSATPRSAGSQRAGDGIAGDRVLVCEPVGPPPDAHAGSPKTSAAEVTVATDAQKTMAGEPSTKPAKPVGPQKAATAAKTKVAVATADKPAAAVLTGEAGTAPADATSAASHKRKAHEDAKRRSDEGQQVQGQPATAQAVPSSAAAASAATQAAAQAAAQTVPPAPSTNGAASGPAAVSPHDPSAIRASAAQAAPLARTAVQAQAQQDNPDTAGVDKSDGRGPASARTAGKAMAKASAAFGASKDTQSQEADSGASLRDIVRSLPPGIQAQLAPHAGASAAGLANVSGSVHAGGSAPSTGAQLSGQVIDMGVSGQWIDRMAREISSLASGSGYSRFQLSPPNLGRIQVDLWQGDVSTNVRLITETDEAARRLRDGQGALQSHAQVAALSLGSVTVEKSATPFDQNPGQNQRQMPDFGSQAQQQAGDQARNQPPPVRNVLNVADSHAVIGSDQRVAPTTSTRPADGGRVRYA